MFKKLLFCLFIEVPWLVSSQATSRKLLFCLFILFFSNQSVLFAQKKFYEIGLAEQIEEGKNNKKLLGIHRTLPIGTKVLVKNNTNGRTAVVKIVGKLPNTGSNDRLVIKISKSAYEALNAKGKRFGVELFPAPKEEKVKEEVAKEEEDSIHQVGKGETLYGVAQKYKVTIKELIDWNNLKTDELSIGQKLKIVKK